MSSDAGQTSSAGTIGRYRTLSELGRGAMGVVYRGFDPVIGRTVALKTLAIDTRDPHAKEFRDRLYREAAAAGALSHPNIVTIYDIIEQGGMAAVAMEFIEGRSLAALIAESAPLSIEVAVGILDQMCSALDYAGSRGIVHRDIKPANILLTADGRVKITDFGIARLAVSTMTQTGTVLGSPSYMSPEQVRGLPLDGRSDLFSAAVVFYEMVTGGRPFSATDIATTMYRIVHEPPTPPEQFNAATPPGISAVLARAFAKNSVDRYQTGAELVAELRSAAGLALPPASPTATIPSPFATAPQPARPLVPAAPDALTVPVAVETVLVTKDAPSAAPTPVAGPASAAVPQPVAPATSAPVPEGPKQNARVDAPAMPPARPAEPSAAQPAPDEDTEVVPSGRSRMVWVIGAFVTVAVAVGLGGAAYLGVIPGLSTTSSHQAATAPPASGPETQAAAPTPAVRQPASSPAATTAIPQATAPAPTAPPASTGPATRPPMPTAGLSASGRPGAPVGGSPAGRPVQAGPERPGPRRGQPPRPVEANQLDERPGIVTRVPPVYPPDAVRRRLEDVVVLRVLVDPDGHPTEVQVLRGSEKDPAFNEAAVTAVRRWTFSAGRRGGQPVPYWHNVAVPFQLPR